MREEITAVGATMTEAKLSNVQQAHRWHHVADIAFGRAIFSVDGELESDHAEATASSERSDSESDSTVICFLREYLLS